MIANIFKKHDKSSQKFEIKTNAFTSYTPSVNWSSSEFSNFEKNYTTNIIAYRCVTMIARSASYIPLKLYKIDNGVESEIQNHPILDLFKKPNKDESYSVFMEKIYSSLLISGNIFILMQKNNNQNSMTCIKPDRVSILSNSKGNIIYRVKEINSTKFNDYPKLDDGSCQILHIKTYNPLNEHYGLSAFEVAKYSIEQHNESSHFNKALLQNFARPSGALVVHSNEYNKEAKLTDEQYERLREQITYNFSANNNGRPMLLEGGLDWKEMSISPKDMDFIESRKTCTREIALAFGVPPQLLGIQGDNTYSNMSEARLALWEQTIIPFINFVINSFEDYIRVNTGEVIDLKFDKNQIATLSSNRDSEWDKISRTTFLTINEKRKILGFDSIPQGDVIEGQVKA
jgi:HK97 family phage portal protein